MSSSLKTHRRSDPGACLRSASHLPKRARPPSVGRAEQASPSSAKLSRNLVATYKPRSQGVQHAGLLHSQTRQRGEKGFGRAEAPVFTAVLGARGLGDYAHGRLSLARLRIPRLSVEQSERIPTVWSTFVCVWSHGSCSFLAGQPHCLGSFSNGASHWDLRDREQPADYHTDMPRLWSCG